MILKINYLMKINEGLKKSSTSGFVLETSASMITSAYTTVKNLEFKAVFYRNWFLVCID